MVSRKSKWVPRVDGVERRQVSVAVLIVQFPARVKREAEERACRRTGSGCWLFPLAALDLLGHNFATLNLPSKTHGTSYDQLTAHFPETRMDAATAASLGRHGFGKRVRSPAGLGPIG